MTNELLAENSVLTQQRDLMIREYLHKVECCDECIAENFCIKNDLRTSQQPQDYCQNNLTEYLKSRLYPHRSNDDIPVTIYVATHQRDPYIKKILSNPIFVPIHCGKAIYVENGSEGFLPSLSDDTGDNISRMNRHYCELTATYWVWKNSGWQPNAIVGINHYRRYFRELDESKNEPIHKETVISLLNEVDFLVNGCGTEYDGTKPGDTCVYETYGQIHEAEDMENAIIAIHELFPYIAGAIEYELKHSGAMSLCNMLVTRKDKFDKYCEFLFPVLAKVESKIDWTEGRRQGYGARALGFLSERLLRPWLKVMGYSGRAIPCLDWEKYSGYKQFSV